MKPGKPSELWNLKNTDKVAKATVVKKVKMMTVGDVVKQNGFDPAPQYHNVATTTVAAGGNLQEPYLYFRMRKKGGQWTEWQPNHNNQWMIDPLLAYWGNEGKDNPPTLTIQTGNFVRQWRY